MSNTNSTPSPAPLHRLLSTADELPSMGGGSVAAIVAGALFLIGFAATIAIYWMNYAAQIDERAKRRRVHGMGLSNGDFSPSSDGSPMSARKAMDVIMFDESPSRSSTPEFDHLVPPTQHHAASFRIPTSPMSINRHATQPAMRAVQKDGDVNPPPRTQSYFVDSDEELLDARRRPAAAPLVGGSRVHMNAASTDDSYFDM